MIKSLLVALCCSPPAIPQQDWSDAALWLKVIPQIPLQQDVLVQRVFAPNLEEVLRVQPSHAGVAKPEEQWMLDIRRGPKSEAMTFHWTHKSLAPRPKASLSKAALRLFASFDNNSSPPIPFMLRSVTLKDGYYFSFFKVPLQLDYSVAFKVSLDCETVVRVEK